MSYRFLVSLNAFLYTLALVVFLNSASEMWKRDSISFGYFLFLFMGVVVASAGVKFLRGLCRGTRYTADRNLCVPNWSSTPCFWERFDIRVHTVIASAFFFSVLCISRFFVYVGPGSVLILTEKEGKSAWEEKKLAAGQHASYHMSVPTTFFAESISNGDSRELEFLGCKVILSVNFMSTCTGSLMRDGKPIALVPKEDTVRIGKVLLDRVEAELRVVEADFKKAIGPTNLIESIGVQTRVGFFDVVAKRLRANLVQNKSHVDAVRGELYTGSLTSVGITAEGRGIDSMGSSKKTTSTT
ncbi:MAG: hypothetical protein HZA95_01740 [Candidatus Vogelbacteria bacterium]|nr:hypothetical protein [Candidatus Vogelbacteria bacterium]